MISEAEYCHEEKWKIQLRNTRIFVTIFCDFILLLHRQAKIRINKKGGETQRGQNEETRQGKGIAKERKKA
jgi:hypothetical protein